MTQTVEKFQLRGHCPCCGREHAVPNGLMAHHGYTVEHGYFKCPCSAGNRHKPIEDDRTVADAVVAHLRKDARKHTEHANEIKSGKDTPTTVTRRINWKKSTQIPYAEGTDHEKSAACAILVNTLEYMARCATDLANFIQAAIDAFHGKPLRVVAKEDGPAPIQYGEKRKTARGVCTVTSVVGARVSWTDERGFKGWTGSRAWRQYPMA